MFFGIKYFVRLQEKRLRSFEKRNCAKEIPLMENGKFGCIPLMGNEISLMGNGDSRYKNSG